MSVKIKRISTLEANVSQRTINFEVFVDGSFITSFDDICEALDFKESLESGDILVDWSRVSK